MDANELWQGFRRAVEEADEHLDAGRVTAALAIFRRVAEVLRGRPVLQLHARDGRAGPRPR